MRRFILHIVLTFAALIVVDGVYGQSITTISGDWNGGALASGTYQLGNNTTVKNTLQINNGQNVTIDLNGMVLKGNGLDAVISVENGGNLTIKDSKPNTGHQGKLNSEGLFVWGSSETTMTVEGGIICNVYENASTNRKGIVVSGTCTIERAKIMGCFTPGIGAAVTVSSSGTFIMEAGEIRYNYSKKYESSGLSGVIYGEPSNKNSGSTINISNTIISDNKTDGDGGAICAYNVTLTTCTIERNQAGRDGGAMFIRNNDNGGFLKIENCTIKHNSARYGGGIYSKVKTEIKNTYIDTNYAKISGGGIQSSAATTISNSFIIGNRAMETETGVNENGGGAVNHGRGGGFNFVGSSDENTTDETAITFILDNTIVSGNACMYYGGGGQMQEKAKVILKNNTQINENISILKGAAGLHVTGGGFFYMNNTCEISGNKALGGVGGAIHSSYECKLHLDGGTISDNIVYGRGGGVHVNTGGDLVLNGTNITGNKAYDGYNLVSCEIYKDNANQYWWNDPVKSSEADKSPGYGGGVLVNSGSCTMETGALSGNYAQTLGGGIALVMAEAGSYAHHVRLANFMLNGGEVSNNTTDGDGAGIYLMENVLSYLDDSEKKNYTYLIEGGDWIPKIILNGGSIKNNSAERNGGGAYQEQKTQFIVNKNKIINIEGNNAEVSGGAVYIASGSFTVEGTANIKSNKATKNDGGAIYLGEGTVESPSQFTVAEYGVLNLGGETISDANTAGGNGGALFCSGTFTVNGTLNLQYNSATNGGGVCVENGAVTLAAGKESVVSNNTASKYGGGLYVTGTEDASFNGGTFRNNKAYAGGGVFASGKKKLVLASNVMANEAVIGGGIYLENGVNMEFGNGLIVANSAKTANPTSPGTAYRKNAESTDLYGVGGGIFMADGVDTSNPTKLTFANLNELGIYNNEATYAGADICANGNYTFIELPNPKQMDLSDNSTIGNELYWVEDYVTGDTDYSNGMNVNSDVGGIRYVDALLDTSKPISRLVFEDNDSKREIEKYACLDLGYDLVFVTLQTDDLDLNEYALIQISYKDKDNKMVSYDKVLFNGVAEGTFVKQVIGLPSGDWNFNVTDWMTEKYDKPSYNPNHINDYINIKREGLNGANDNKTEITIIFTELLNKNIIEAHKRIVNYMK